ncbi:MAG TPA: hypothetical protein VFA60_05025 [Terriglobales bacterium]|nr:hypothetical protein [Terriglobales bacterium]
MQNARVAAVLMALAMLAACSSEPKKAEAPTVPAKPRETEARTGREAFQRLYATARQWAADARPVRLESGATNDANGHDGKAAIWRTQFASAGRRGIEAFIWSGTSGPDAPERGVSHGAEDTWTPGNASTVPFDVNFLKVDSDGAVKTAEKHGGDKVLKSRPDTPVVYLLDWDMRKSELVWHVIYGRSRSDAALVVDVNATTGEFLRVEK